MFFISRQVSFTFAFFAGAMDSMLVPMMGTSEAALPTVSGPICKAMFLGFTICNAAITALLYPSGKYEQLVAACFMFGFYIPMFAMYKSGMMGVPGCAQYGIMNTIFGGIAVYNYLKM